MGRHPALERRIRRLRAALERPAEKAAVPPLGEWLRAGWPSWRWDWPYLLLVQRHLERLARREIDRLALFLPPRHGKSELTTVRHPVWRLQRDPSLRVVVGGYNQTFADKLSRKIRKAAAGRLRISRERNSAKEWETEEGGGVRACGVGSPPTGLGADLLVIDDPVKRREEADSEAYRERVWEWYSEDLLTRLEPGGAVCLIQTRWHSDDLAGRILAGDDAASWTVVNLPALAEPGDPLGRAEGEALCPERYPAEALERIRRTMGPLPFSALYQQRPVPREGGLFTEKGLGQECPWPPAQDVAAWVRAWDLGYASEGDPTAGALMARLKDGRFVLCDVEAFRLHPSKRNERMKAVAEADDARLAAAMVPAAKPWRRVQQLVEQPPGAGSEVTKAVIAALAGHAVQAVLPRGDKAERATPLASQCEAGNVLLVPGPWARDFRAQALLFPAGVNDDMVDAAAHAFNWLAQKVPFSMTIL